jgi:hypothetical protein
MADVLKVLLSFLARQPAPIRWVGFIVLLVAVSVGLGFAVYGALKPVVPSAAGSNEKEFVAPVGSYSGGQQINRPDGEKIDLAFEPSALAQQHAAVWHNRHSGQDDPKWIYIENGDQTQSFVKYRFYKKSDGCVNVVRSQQGVPTDQWIMNPLPAYKLHTDTEPYTEDLGSHQIPRFAEGAIEGSDGSHGRVWGVLHFFEAALYAQTVSPQSDLHGQTAHMRPVSAASNQCLNPHPGNFKWWWGAETDQCWAPMYRQFDDGCQHLQRYNRCANAWDQRIEWQVCIH